jgi:hypothetical protein
MPETSQLNTDRSHPGRWTTTFNNPPINMFLPATIGPGRLWELSIRRTEWRLFGGQGAFVFRILYL